VPSLKWAVKLHLLVNPELHKMRTKPLRALTLALALMSNLSFLACTKPNPQDAEIKRLESDLSSLAEQKAALESKIKGTANQEQNIEVEQEMELLKSRWERLNDKLQELKK
jgi:hypothetical protein